jgi:hypothetical protein
MLILSSHLACCYSTLRRMAVKELRLCRAFDVYREARMAATPASVDSAAPACHEACERRHYLHKDDVLHDCSMCSLRTWSHFDTEEWEEECGCKSESDGSVASGEDSNDSISDGSAELELTEAALSTLHSSMREAWMVSVANLVTSVHRRLHCLRCTSDV